MTRRAYSPGLKRWIEVETLEIPEVPAKKKRTKEFIMVPMEWAKRLTRATSVSTYRLAHTLLHRAWKNGNRPIRLANKGLEETGLSRWEKSRALKELEGLGLIAVDRRCRKSPIVTVLKPT